VLVLLDVFGPDGSVKDDERDEARAGSNMNPDPIDSLNPEGAACHSSTHCLDSKVEASPMTLESGDPSVDVPTTGATPTTSAPNAATTVALLAEPPSRPEGGEEVVPESGAGSTAPGVSASCPSTATTGSAGDDELSGAGRISTMTDAPSSGNCGVLATTAIDRSTEPGRMLPYRVQQALLINTSLLLTVSGSGSLVF
jgi:hypothetical protein